MTDPRLTPDPTQITMREPAQIVLPIVDLCRKPDGPRDRQLVLGAQVTRLGSADGWAYVQTARDGYCGYLGTAALGPVVAPTHKVSAAATHAYLRADFKSPDQLRLSFGAQMTAQSTDGKFIETPFGFVPRQHLTPVQNMASDPAEIAALFLGTPYLWGGNSRDGIDCSGLIQTAFHACGIDCPGDSDMQETTVGQLQPTGATYARNDLLFWKGHVALVVDDTTLIHANAHHMAVALEPINDAINRIKNQGDGTVTAHRRSQLPNGSKTPSES